MTWPRDRWIGNRHGVGGRACRGQLAQVWNGQGGVVPRSGRETIDRNQYDVTVLVGRLERTWNETREDEGNQDAHADISA